MGTGEFDYLIGQLTSPHPAINVSIGEAHLLPEVAPGEKAEPRTERDEREEVPAHLSAGYLSPRAEASPSLRTDQGSRPAIAQREAPSPMIYDGGLSDVEAVLEPEPNEVVGAHEPDQWFLQSAAYAAPTVLEV